MFTVPVFNLLYDGWDAGNTPNASAPIFVAKQCQLYIASKGMMDIEPGELTFWVPPIYARIPIGDLTEWLSLWILECPQASGRFYRVRWKEKMHQGFSNEYLVCIVDQCDGDGVPILRDVYNSAGGIPGAYVFMEDGSQVLLEDSTFMLLE
jgi:hypothetical protein